MFVYNPVFIVEIRQGKMATQILIAAISISVGLTEDQSSTDDDNVRMLEPLTKQTFS